VNTGFEWGNSYDDARESDKRLKLLISDMGEPGTVMDLGANMGFFSYGLSEAGHEVTAVEPPNRKKFRAPVKEHRTWVQAPEDLPDGPFDYAIVFSVLHHIPAWKSVLEAVFERTSRRAYVEIPHPEEFHHKWHGSLEQHEYLKSLENARVIGAHFEVSRRFKRHLWRVDL